MKLRSCRSVLRVKYDGLQKQCSGHSTLEVSGTISFSEGAIDSGSRGVTEHKIPHTSCWPRLAQLPYLCKNEGSRDDTWQVKVKCLVSQKQAGTEENEATVESQELRV